MSDRYKKRKRERWRQRKGRGNVAASTSESETERVGERDEEREREKERAEVTWLRLQVVLSLACDPPTIAREQTREREREMERAQERSADLTRGSPSTSVSVYTKHVQRRLDGGVAVNVFDRIHQACAYEV